MDLVIALCTSRSLLKAEATWHARPRFEGLDLDASVTALDVLPFVLPAGQTPLDPVSSGQPVRARLGGAVKMSLRPLNWDELHEGSTASGTGPILPDGAREAVQAERRSAMFEGREAAAAEFSAGMMLFACHATPRGM